MNLRIGKKCQIFGSNRKKISQTNKNCWNWLKNPHGLLHYFQNTGLNRNVLPILFKLALSVIHSTSKTFNYSIQSTKKELVVLIVELYGFGLIRSKSKSNPFYLDLDWIWIRFWPWIGLDFGFTFIFGFGLGFGFKF